MNSWQKTVLENLLPRGFAVFRWLMTLLIVVSLASCGEKAVSQDVAIGYTGKPQQISKEFSEVSPPATIQEIRPALEVYQPQVAIVTPQSDELLQDNKVTVRFQVKDLPIFKNPQLELGPHLHVILDNQPYIAVYDLNQPLVFSDLAPGTHTLRVFASRPWHESFKNEGAYAQTTFHIVTKTEDNNPDPSLPLLTYSRPKGDYGAEPILLDFYLTNAPLHLVAQDNVNDNISDWRIRCTINGESFVLDRWQAIYLKGFKPGKNWVKLEFLDNQGNPVKNVFNTTVGLINYQPKGKDTLSRIVRGELTADEVRSIVDPNYTAKLPPAEPTPTPTPTATPQTQPTPEIEIPQVPVTPPAELKQPEEPKSTLPKPVPLPEPQPEVTPTPSATELPETVSPEPEKPKSGGYFQRRRSSTATPSPSVSPRLPEIIKTPQPESTVSPESTSKPQLEITPTPEATVLPQPQPEVTPVPSATASPQLQIKQPEKTGFSRYFQRRPRPTPQSSPSLPPTLPEVIGSPAPQPTAPSPEATPKPPAIEVPQPQVKNTEEQPNSSETGSPNLLPTPVAP
ncbi:hypothetical protein BV372_20580 [Nostoc sp. T09]|uniref:hypothetical protein n=1 Tax=Nostoc sp. T09 TaxID=1932621 RepID=UPI000B6C073E|nr:hypothetical protein [Nostoc sp. T09]OUL31242.1 hypothetical protein BV372_20580 [Nostoc sp. T09]